VIALAGCGQKSPTLSSSNGADFAQARPPSTKPYTLQFSGDIESGPIPNVMLNSTALLQSVAQAGVHLTLPPTPELAGCGVTGGSWNPYAGEWPGSLIISKSGGTTTLNLKSRWVNNSSSWITVQDDAVQTQANGVVTLTFTDGKGAANVYGQRTVFPCVSFTITAVPQ
jgi:hypothetical protein